MSRDRLAFYPYVIVRVALPALRPTRRLHAGRVVFPLRFDDGSILGFAGFNADKDPPLKLPKL
jgi:hypothetical protein